MKAVLSFVVAALLAAGIIFYPALTAGVVVFGAFWFAIHAALS